MAQYTISGKFLRTFKSITDAEVALSLNSIFQAISNKGSAGGY
ncbi:MAG: NUMOD1 domain-containing DNA-binding protein [Candidatus Coprovivens sp.]